MKTWDAARYQARHSYVFEYGEDLIGLLDPQPGERILDLGCGSGQLTAKIAESGADVTGLDRSAEMIAEARRNFPSLKFELGDAASFTVDAPFDAVFSNAVLHWVKDADGTAASVARALRSGGRFVLEMGGKGNTQAVMDAVREVAGPIETPWYFPSIGPTGANNGGFYPSTAFGRLTSTSSGLLTSTINIADKGKSPQDGFSEYQGYPGTTRPRWGDYSWGIFLPGSGGRIYFANEYIQYRSAQGPRSP